MEKKNSEEDLTVPRFKNNINKHKNEDKDSPSEEITTNIDKSFKESKKKFVEKWKETT